MATKSKEDDTGNKLLWLAGGALVTAGVMYMVKRNLEERDELNRLRFAEGQRSLKGSGE